MQLTGNLKNQVEKANSKAEVKEVIANAGMILTDDKLDMVAGGGKFFADIDKVKNAKCCDGLSNNNPL